MAQTAPSRPMRSDEAAALGVALVGHAALVAGLVLFKPADVAPPVPERMSVTLSDDNALVSTAPVPSVEPAAASAPELGEVPPEPAPEPEQQVTPPKPQPSATPPRPTPRPVAQPRPQLRPQPTVRPTPPRVTPKPTPPGTRPNTRPNPNDKKRPPGSPNLEKDLDSTLGPGGRGRNPPAQATGQQKIAWQNSVSARVQGPWQRCPISGLDVEKLRVVVPFTLGPDGRVVSFGQPRVSGITPDNRSQVEPFKACAIKAIKLGQPYTALPADYYDQWKSRELTFSKGRAQ